MNCGDGAAYVLGALEPDEAERVSGATSIGVPHVVVRWPACGASPTRC